MLLLAQKIFSRFFTLPALSHRMRPTFTILILAINILAGIYSWYWRSFILLAVPLLSLFFTQLGLLTNFLFFGTIMYCSILEHSYKTIQVRLFEGKVSGIASIQEIDFNANKAHYRVTCNFLPIDSSDTATIQLYCKECPLFQPGDRVLLENVVFQEPYNASYKKYLLKESIHATAYYKKLLYTLIENKQNYELAARKKLLDLEKNIASKLSANAYVLFSSLFLGSKKYLDDTNLSVKDYFNRWGINHFLARSGLHLSLLVFLILFMSRVFLFSSTMAQSTTAIFLMSYIIFSYSSVSFLRAVLASGVALWCTIFKVPINMLHVLILCLIALLAYNPFFALFLDFQLTFLLTFGLCMVSLLNSEA